MKILDLTKNEEKIINFLADNFSKEFFSSEIAKKTKISIGGAYNALESLKRREFVLFKKEGRMKFYQIDINNQLVKQYRIIVLLYSLRSFIKKIKKNCVDLILFGSGSRGEYDKESDVDLLVVSRDRDGVIEILENYKNDEKYNIKPIIKTPTAWHELEGSDMEFYQEVLKGIKL
jgi:predicted nucleotidyltransferase